MSGLKEKCTVTILPTEKESNIMLHKLYTKLQLTDKVYKESKYEKPQHLYVLSNDSIKEGDWCFEIHNNPNTQASKDTPRFIDEKGNTWWLRKGNMNYSANDPECKKLVASTDKSLGVGEVSEDFILKYIEQYNKCNFIKDVMVEYEEYCINNIPKTDHTCVNKDTKPKLRDDNTIIITKIKDSFTLEELKKAYEQGASIAINNRIWGDVELTFDEWFDKNY